MFGDEHDRSAIDGIVRDMISFINDGDFDGLRKAPYYASPVTSNRKFQDLNEFEELCKTNPDPDRRIHIVDLTIEFDDKKGASVYMNGYMAGGDGLEIPGMTLMNLRKISGEWQFTDSTSFRGPETVIAKGSTSETSNVRLEGKCRGQNKDNGYQ